MPVLWSGVMPGGRFAQASSSALVTALQDGECAFFAVRTKAAFFIPAVMKQVEVGKAWLRPAGETVGIGNVPLKLLTIT